MSIEIQIYESENLEVFRENNKITFIGRMEPYKVEDFFNSFLNDFHKDIINNNIKSVTVDITEVEYINSAGVSFFFYWVSIIENLEDDLKYTLNMVSDKKQLWQKFSIPMLLYTSSSIVNILDNNTEKIEQDKLMYDTLLTETEKKICKELITDKTYKDIANKNFITVNTVRHHVRNIYKKLNINKKAELLSYINKFLSN